MKMNQSVSDWINALRSGEYRQAKDAMKRQFSSSEGDVGYCCLGVAHCVVGDGEFVQDQDYEDVRFGIDVGEFEQEITMGSLPADEAEVLWLTSDDQDRLAGFNDSGTVIYDPLTFDQIANVIERAANDEISVRDAAIALGYLDDDSAEPTPSSLGDEV